jgi:Cytochrome c554 and c-prime
MSSWDFASRAERKLMRLPFLGLVLLVGCGSDPDDATLPRADLLRPETCLACHSEHYREWSGSMHAYAADDPVFLAMNARGQRETSGALGDFCVKCHAPMAVQEGATRDGLNLAEVPQELKGVTCYFCHQVEDVEGTHNNALSLANDTTLRGSIEGAMSNDAHRSRYSARLDRSQRGSAELCGACHDVTNAAGVQLERTFAEWQASLFGKEVPEQQLTCGQCHMTGRDGRAAEIAGAPQRRVHEHTFAGVDVALTPWPEMEAQRAAIARDLDPAILTELCVAPDLGGARIDVTLDNFLVGHRWPSGAAQDRRAWLELVAYRGADVIYQSGAPADGQPLALLDDPDLFLLRDRLFDARDNEIHMFWDARRLESKLLAPVVTNDASEPGYYHASTWTYRIATQVPDRITLRLLLRPIGLEIIGDLIESGDLAPEIGDQIPVLALAGSTLEWTDKHGFSCVK